MSTESAMPWWGHRFGGPCAAGRAFFFVNKKEAKKTLIIWALAGENARSPN
jgi:hypothetical protein